MYSIKRFASMCLLMGGLWVSAPVLAGELPDLESTSPNASIPHNTPTASKQRDALCTKCHDTASSIKPILDIYQTKHGIKGDSRAPTCQSCHGESLKHAKNADETPPDVLFNKKLNATFKASDAKEQNTACLSCHGKDANRTHWEGGAHQANGVACASCHEVHASHDKVRDKKTQPEVCFACHKEQRAQSKKLSHHPIAEGKVACSDCHNPHGSSNSKMLKKNTTNETCYTCHAEKRGPHLFEHQPVTEDCASCHNPHGSNMASLLKSRPPFLCQECHDGPHVSANPAGPNAAGKQGGFTGANPSVLHVGSACMNCHVMVHGSNSPAGGHLER